MRQKRRLLVKKRKPTVFLLKRDFKHGTSTIHKEVKNELKFFFKHSFCNCKCSFFLWRISHSQFYNPPSTKNNDTSWDNKKSIKQSTKKQPISSPNVHIFSQLIFPLCKKETSMWFIRDFFIPDRWRSWFQPFERVTEIHHTKKVTKNCQAGIILS